MKQKTCIRVYTDQASIDEGRRLLISYEQELTQLAKGLGLAGNKVRLSIIFLLHQYGKLCVCDLSDVLSMSMAAISQHLRKLKDGGYLKSERVGQTIFYRIEEKHQDFFQQLLSFILMTENELLK